MYPTVPIALFGWFLLALLLFATLPGRRATLVTLIGGWLFLPFAGFSFEGIPDYGKFEAISYSALAGALIFDPATLLRFRPRWFDIPILVWVFVSPVATALANGLGLYYGAGVAVGEVSQYGIPYLLGRVYFNDLVGMRELAIGVVLGGLVYIPLALIETEMSPQFHNWVYGFQPAMFLKSIRLGGYRPLVFLGHGITLGWWMAAAALVAAWLWWTRSRRSLWGIPFGWLALALLLTNPLWRAINGMALLLMGLAVLALTRWLRTPVFLVMLVILPPLYVSARVLGDWQPSGVVSLAGVVLPEERVSSFQYRLNEEGKLLTHARQRPIFGWGGYGRSRPDEEGRSTAYAATPDSLWIVAIGKRGLLGMVSLGLVLVLPLALLLHRLGAREWANPVYAPAAALGVVVALFAMDCMLNSKINPVYFCAAGAVMSFRPRALRFRTSVRNRSMGTLRSRSAAPPLQRSNRWALASLLLLALIPAASVRAQSSGAAWKRNWELKRGFSMSIDTAGYSFPTAVAFVPNPGEGPKDPLYFVTELRGKIKVVTNDRSVYTFAEDFFHLMPIPEDIEKGKVPEVGMAGLCLDEEHGYVFVSFAYHESDGTVRNSVMRFQSEPGTFSLKPTGRVAFDDVFAGQPGSESHMIGPMAIDERGRLYVNVGDALTAELTQNLDYVVGKILRMTLDGGPVADNPFYTDDGRDTPRDYIWAYGFRNPFGLEIVRGEVFATDVGPSVDRFVHVKPGLNYGYDGSDWSISSHADIVFAPSVSPVQLRYMPADNTLFPEAYRDRFYVAASGLQGDLGPAESGGKSILMIDYDFDQERVVGRPRPLLTYRGKGAQMPVSVAIGPDGLYMAALHADGRGRTAIYRITYNPEKGHPVVADRVRALMGAKGCLACHDQDRPGPGPSLDRDKLVPRLRKRLNSEQYIRKTRELDRLETEPFKSYRDAREEVRQAEGLKKIHTYIVYQLLQPRFDDRVSMMPDLGLTREQAERVADYLVAAPEPRSLSQRAEDLMASYFPKPRLRHLIAFFAVGGGVGFLAGILLLLAVRWGWGAWSAKRNRVSRGEDESFARPGVESTER